MKGTETQVKWASEIKKNVINTLSGAKEQMLILNNSAGAEEIDERIAALEAVEYAGDFIQVFGGIRFKGDLVNDFKEVLAVYRMTGGHDYDKMLCKNKKNK